MSQNKYDQYFGFKVPENFNLNTFIKCADFPEKQQILADLQNLKEFDSKEFYSKINRKQVSMEKLISRNISKIDLAFYTSFDPKRIILSDADANAQKIIESTNLHNVNKNDEEQFINKQEIRFDNKTAIKPEDSIDMDILQLYCRIDCQFNRQFRQNGDFMINCCNSTCDQWFHPKCIGLGDITPEDANKIQFYCSDLCKQETKKSTNRFITKKKIKYC